MDFEWALYGSAVVELTKVWRARFIVSLRIIALVFEIFVQCTKLVGLTG